MLIRRSFLPWERRVLIDTVPFILRVSHYKNLSLISPRKDLSDKDAFTSRNGIGDIGFSERLHLCKERERRTLEGFSKKAKNVNLQISKDFLGDESVLCYSTWGFFCNGIFNFSRSIYAVINPQEPARQMHQFIKIFPTWNLKFKRFNWLGKPIKYDCINSKFVTSFFLHIHQTFRFHTQRCILCCNQIYVWPSFKKLYHFVAAIYL